MREYFKNLPDTSTPLTGSRLNGLLNGEESIEKLVVGDIECKNMACNYNGKSETVNGITFTPNSDGSITVNGTATGTAEYRLDENFNINAGTYTISGGTEQVNFNIIETGVYSYGANTTPVTFTLTEDKTKQTLRLRVASGKVINNEVCYPQLEYGEKATSFAQHKKIGYNSQDSMGKIVVDDISCKNLFNIQNAEAYDAVITNVGTNSISFSNNGLYAQLKYHFTLKKNTNYVLKYTFETTNPDFLPYVSIQGDNYWGNELGGKNGTGTHTINFNSGNWNTIDMVFPINGETNLTNVGTLSNVQLEEGTVATEYTPYKNFDSSLILNDGLLKMKESDIINITPLKGSNYDGYGNCYYYKTGTKVHVHLGLSNLTPNDANVVYMLPTGYKPLTAMCAIGVGAGLDDVIALQINIGGEIRILPSTSYALFDFEFDAFN